MRTQWIFLPHMKCRSEYKNTLLKLIIPRAEYQLFHWSSTLYCLKSPTNLLFGKQLFRLTAKQISKLRIVGALPGESIDEQWIPSQRDRNVENVSMSLCRYD